MTTRRLAVLALAGLHQFANGQAPTQQGGSPCETDWDCSLAGVCATANSTCVCDVWATGPSCDLLNLSPASSDNLGFQVPNYHSWGGHAMPDPEVPDLYHGFFSFLCNHSTLGEWTTKSAGVRATASSLEGPYTFAEMVTQPWSHNMMISQAPGGPYLLWQIGNAVTPPSEWSPCYVPPGNDASELEGSKPSHSDGGAAAPARPTAATTASSGSAVASTAVRNGQIYVRSAPALTGPWTPFANGTGITMDFANTWLEANGASGGNPAPFFFPNGSVLLYFTGSPCPTGWGNLAPNCIAAARADAWDAKYTMTSPMPLTHPESEDPFVFRDQRGHFHLLTNVNTFHARCKSGVPCGGHAWSYDGLVWSNLTVGAFGPVVRVVNATADRYIYNAYVERPQVVQAADGTPLALFLGIGRTSYFDSASWAQPFCQAGQANCGAMHPPPPIVVQYRARGACLGTNSSFPCPGGWANSCPLFLVPCDAPEAGWLEHADGSIESAVHTGNCLNLDCDGCTAGTLAKITACQDAAAVPFSNVTGTLAAAACAGMCVDDGTQAAAANPPCKAGEQYLPHGQATLQRCGSEGTSGWARVVVSDGLAQGALRSQRWHYHWNANHGQPGNP